MKIDQDAILSAWQLMPHDVPINDDRRLLDLQLRCNDGFEWVWGDPDDMEVPAIDAPEHYLRLRDVISSADLLYRLAICFEGEVRFEGQAGDKWVWRVPLRHVATDHLLVFTEYRGDAKYYAVLPPNNDESAFARFQADAEQLMELLTMTIIDHPSTSWHSIDSTRPTSH